MALAFILAPGCAALLLAITTPAYEGLSDWSERVWRTAVAFSVFGAYPAAIVLGLPGYFMLRRHLSARPIACAITGFVVAALPWAFLFLAGPGASDASIGERATVINGHTTAYGWLNHAGFVLTIGLIGAVGGFVFWAIAAAGHRVELTPSER